MRGRTGTTGPHGSVARYVGGCRCEPCTKATATYNKRRILEGKPRRIPSLGTRRRIEALSALGWSRRQIAARLGVDRTAVGHLLTRDVVQASTARKVAAVYEDMCMKAPVGTTRDEKSSIGRAKSYARRQGFAPPLAWDDIDDPAEKPSKALIHKEGHHNADIDEWMFLVRGGEDPERAARRLGVTVNAIEQQGRRKNRPDVYLPAARAHHYSREAS